MPAQNEPAKSADKWQRFGHVELHAADAVECGWSREAAAQALATLLGERATITAAELRAALDAAPTSGAADGREIAAQLAEELLDYRLERTRVAAAYQPIRHTKINLKRLLKSPDVTVDQLRALARDLGWTVREDEEGVTVPVDDLIPYFRRPIVRQLLDAKMKQCGMAGTT